MHYFNFNFVNLIILLVFITSLGLTDGKRLLLQQLFRRQSPTAPTGSQCDYNEANLVKTNASTSFVEKIPPVLEGKPKVDGVVMLPHYEEALLNARMKLMAAIPTSKEEATARVRHIAMVQEIRKQKGFIFSPRQVLEEFMELTMSAYFMDDEVKYYNITPHNYQVTPNMMVHERFKGLEQLIKMLHAAIIKFEADRGNPPGNKNSCTNLANSLKTQAAAWKTGNAPGAYDLVAGCLESHAFSEERMMKSLEALKFMVNSFYVYQGFLVKGYSLPDVIEAAILMKPKLSTDYRAQQFLSDIVATMAYDAGLRYYPIGYQGFIFMLPIMVESYVELRVRTVLRILKVDPRYPALTQYEGAEIITINEVLTLEALKTFSERRSYTMDHRTGYTRMLSRKVLTSNYTFGYRRGVYFKRVSLPFNSKVCMLVKKRDQRPVEIEIPWLVYQSPDLANFTDMDSFWKNNLDPNTALNKDAKYMGDPGPTKMGTPPIVQPGKNYSLENLKDPDDIAPAVTGPKFALYFLDDYFADGPYAVLVISSFDVGTSDFKNWVDSLLKALKTVQDKGIRNLLLDLSGNTGGNVCLCYILSAMFLPYAQYEPFPAAPRAFGSVVYYTRMLEKMEKCSEEKSKVTPFTMPFYQNHSSFHRFEQHNKWKDTRYFNNTQYSVLLRDYCVTPYTRELEKFKASMKTLKLTLLSDGYCGGCAGAVMASLQFNNYSAIVAITSGRTSIDTITAPVYAFPNIQLMSLSQVRDIAKGTSCEKYIPSLPVNAQIYVPFRAGMTLNNTVAPLQISVMRAHYVIDVGTGVGISVHGRWVNAIRKMNYTKEPEEVPDPDAY